jgi:hypothetical protein
MKTRPHPCDGWGLASFSERDRVVEIRIRLRRSCRLRSATLKYLLPYRSSKSSLSDIAYTFHRQSGVRDISLRRHPAAQPFAHVARESGSVWWDDRSAVPFQSEICGMLPIPNRDAVHMRIAVRHCADHDRPRSPSTVNHNSKDRAALRATQTVRWVAWCLPGRVPVVGLHGQSLPHPMT